MGEPSRLALVKKGTVVLHESDLGKIGISQEAIATIAGRAVDESFGVVDQAAGRRGPLRLLRRGRADRGVRVRERDDGLALELHVVVDYGINLGEVTAMVRSRVMYEVERHTGIPVAEVEVHVDDARKAG